VRSKLQKVVQTVSGPSLFRHASGNSFYLMQSRKDFQEKILKPPVLLRATREHREDREKKER